MSTYIFKTDIIKIDELKTATATIIKNHTRIENINKFAY